MSSDLEKDGLAASDGTFGSEYASPSDQSSSQQRVPTVSAAPSAPSLSPDQLRQKAFFLRAATRAVKAFVLPAGELSHQGESKDPGKNKILFSVEDLSRALDNACATIENPDFERGAATFANYLSLFFDESSTAYVDDTGKHELFKFALSSSLSPEFMSTIQFRIGLGTHDLGDTSLRLPAYIQPVVSFVSRLTSLYRERDEEVTSANLPEVVVYSATNMLKHVNSLDHHRAAQNTEYFFHVFRRYIESVIPLPVAQKAFVFRRDIHANDPHITERLLEVASRILTTFSDHDVLKKILGTASRHHSSDLDGMKYAVSHAVYSLDPLEFPYKSFMEDESDELHPSVIMVGGKAEIPYWKVRQMARDHSATQYSRAQIIQKRCEIPPYAGAMYKDDLTTADLQSSERFQIQRGILRTSIRKDIDVSLPPGCQSIDDMVSYFRSLFDIV